jgi:hypothetical protein
VAKVDSTQLLNCFVHYHKMSWQQMQIEVKELQNYLYMQTTHMSIIP